MGARRLHRLHLERLAPRAARALSRSLRPALRQSADPQLRVLVQSVGDGTMLGGIRGLLIGGRSQVLKSQPPC